MKTLPPALFSAILLALSPAPARAHEERLAVGQVETIQPAGRLLVLREAAGGARLRLEINPETEVVACGTATGLAAVSPGATVRVKYLEKPGEAPEARALLLLGPGRRGR
jgi:hypothetical protein